MIHCITQYVMHCSDDEDNKNVEIAAEFFAVDSLRAADESLEAIHHHSAQDDISISCNLCVNSIKWLQVTSHVSLLDSTKLLPAFLSNF